MTPRTSLHLRCLTLAGLTACALCAAPAVLGQEHGHDDYDLAREIRENMRRDTPDETELRHMRDDVTLAELEYRFPILWTRKP